MKLVISILMLSFFLSCNNHDKNLQILEELNQGLINSAGIIDSKNRSLMADFQRNLQYPFSKEKAQIWKPKADSVMDMADKEVLFIEELKTEIMKEAGQENENNKFRHDDVSSVDKIMTKNKNEELFFRLNRFRKNLLNLDKSIENEFGGSLPINTSQSSNADTVNLWIKQKFEGTNTMVAIAYLSKLENDIKVCEALVIEYFNRRSRVIIDRYEEYNALIASNSQIFKPAQELIIRAGVGAFSRAAQPQIKIDGRMIHVNAEGYAEYKTKVLAPGKYSKVVEVSFVKPDGTPEIVTHNMEYEVTNCGNIPKENNP